MRTKTLVLTAALSAASLATSMAQVYSVNAVGYVNVTVTKGWNLIANPLNNGGNTLEELLPHETVNLPSNTYVATWNPMGGSTGNVDSELPTLYPGVGGAWFPAGSALPPGKAFFMYVDPQVATQESYTFTFVGEVPQGQLSTSVTGGNRYNALASQVPQAGKVTTDLGLTAVDQDQILIWDKVANAFGQTLYTYFDGVGWTDGANVNEPSIGVGDGFFLFRTANVNVPWTRTFNVN